MRPQKMNSYEIENNWELSNIQEKEDYSKWIQIREENRFLMPLLFLLSQLDF